MQRWLTMSAAALGRAIGKGDIDPVALAKTYLDAIDAHSFADRIYTVVTHERALTEAAASAEGAKLGLASLAPRVLQQSRSAVGTIKLREHPDRLHRRVGAVVVGIVCPSVTHLLLR